MAKLPAPTEGIALTHFVVSDDVQRSARFYSDILGGEVRGYLRDPDGHLIEVGQSTRPR